MVNLKIGDSFINIGNAGTQNTASGALTNTCANVYAFSPDEFLVSHCSRGHAGRAGIPFGPARLAPKHALLILPTSLVVNLVASAGGTCNASSVSAASLAPGMVAWGTTIHALPTLRCHMASRKRRFRGQP